GKRASTCSRPRPSTMAWSMGVLRRAQIDSSIPLSKLDFYLDALNYQAMPKVCQWPNSCSVHIMETTMAPEELLDRATAFVKSHRNMEMLDRATILRGYLGLTKLDPDNGAYRKYVEEAFTHLLQYFREVPPS